MSTQTFKITTDRCSEPNVLKPDFTKTLAVDRICQLKYDIASLGHVVWKCVNEEFDKQYTNDTCGDGFSLSPMSKNECALTGSAMLFAYDPKPDIDRFIPNDVDVSIKQRYMMGVVHALHNLKGFETDQIRFISPLGKEGCSFQPLVLPIGGDITGASFTVTLANSSRTMKLDLFGSVNVPGNIAMHDHECCRLIGEYVADPADPLGQNQQLSIGTAGGASHHRFVDHPKTTFFYGVGHECQHLTAFASRRTRKYRRRGYTILKAPPGSIAKCPYCNEIMIAPAAAAADADADDTHIDTSTEQFAEMSFSDDDTDDDMI
jgi:hypothetical protein